MKRIILYMSALFLLCSCASEKLPESSDGGVITVSLARGDGEDAATKASVALTDEQAAEYSISIFNADGTVACHNGTTDAIQAVDYSSFKAVEVSMPGSYYVTAESCTEAEAEDGYGCPRYYGRSETFALNASNITENAQVICSQTNARVTVVFDSNLSGAFQNLTVALYSDRNAGRTVTVPESGGSVSSYFNPSVLTYRITGTYKATDHIGTTDITLDGTVALAAKDNVRLVVKLDMSNGILQTPAIEVVEEFDSQKTPDCAVDPYKYIDGNE